MGGLIVVKYFIVMRNSRRKHIVAVKRPIRMRNINVPPTQACFAGKILSKSVL